MFVRRQDRSCARNTKGARRGITILLEGSDPPQQVLVVLSRLPLLPRTSKRQKNRIHLVCLCKIKTNKEQFDYLLAKIAHPGRVLV